VLIPLIIGVLGMAAFVVTEMRSAHPMVPPEIFRHRAFTGANLVTFLVYAANGGIFFLFVINLQVVAGFSPLAAGIAMLPATVLMLLLSARSGALGQRIGPRIPMTVGPLICALAVLLMSMIGPGASYLTDVLPAVIILGLGLSTLVAPLTATALGSLDDAHAGIASGVNNAVARAASLLSVAILPLAAGLGAGSLTVAGQLQPVYRNAMLICVGLMVGGSVLAFLMIPNRITKPTPPRTFCDPCSPPVQAGSVRSER
jgi:MFS family permease